MDRNRTLIAAGALALALVSPGAAHAAGADHNHDRIPDRWERAHHLSLRVDQSRRDQDHDGLRNRAEYRDHTDPHRRDSDRDGLPDGREDADPAGARTAGERAPPTPTAGPAGDGGGTEPREPIATVVSFAGD